MGLCAVASDAVQSHTDRDIRNVHRRGSQALAIAKVSWSCSSVVANRSSAEGWIVVAWSLVVANYRYTQYVGSRERIYKSTSDARHRRQLVQPWRTSNKLCGSPSCVLFMQLAVRWRKGCHSSGWQDGLNLIRDISRDFSSCLHAIVVRFMVLS